MTKYSRFCVLGVASLVASAAMGVDTNATRSKESAPPRLVSTAALKWDLESRGKSGGPHASGRVQVPAKDLDKVALLPHETKNGGNDLHGFWVSRAVKLLEALREYNRLNAQFPWTLISTDDIDALEKSIKETRVYIWEERPTYKGDPRDAGVFDDPDPKRKGKLAIAVWRELEKKLEKEVNFDELILHEYGLAAELGDEFFHVTGPIIAKLQSAGFAQRKKNANTAGETIVRDGKPGATRVLYFRSEDGPPGVAAFFNAADSAHLYRALGPERVIVGVPGKKGDREASFIFSRPEVTQMPAAGEKDMKMHFVVDAKARPTMGMACLPVDKKITCSMWVWLWPESMHRDAGDPKAKNEAADPRIRMRVLTLEKGVKVLRVELYDPVEALALYDRLELPWEEGSTGKGAEKLSFLTRTFETTDDGNRVSLDAYRWFGAIESFSLAIEIRLDDATAVDTKDQLASLRERAFRAHKTETKLVVDAKKVLMSHVDDQRRKHEDVLRDFKAKLAAARRPGGFKPFQQGDSHAKDLWFALGLE